ncbi:MAG: inosine/xanthosine triphosphatase, partial [Candidatus Korarchaeum sp.]
GSTNPVKVEAVRRAFSRFWEVEVRGVKVDSEVPAEPFGAAAMEGARNRARKALRTLNADFGVGIEGGIFYLFGNYYCAGFVWVERSDGAQSTGTSGWFECPRSFLPELLTGTELGDLMAKLSGKDDIKREEGAIGFFTRGTVNRVDLYTHGVLMALVKFVAADRWPG